MVFAHPQLPAEVSRQLAVPLLEAVVCEVLDGQQELHRVASLQVGHSHAAPWGLTGVGDPHQAVEAWPRGSWATTGSLS